MHISNIVANRPLTEALSEKISRNNRPQGNPVYELNTDPTTNLRRQPSCSLTINNAEVLEHPQACTFAIASSLFMKLELINTNDVNDGSAVKVIIVSTCLQVL